jgi:hypothetical protein
MGSAVTLHDAAPGLRLSTLDTILGTHAPALGADFEGYRNHTYRVAYLCLAQLSGSTEEIEKVAIAAAFHDLGIWTDRTFDFLAPSATLARAYLAGSGRAEWTPEITETICGHHQVSRYRGHDAWLVEPFRRADWMDVSMGAITWGLPRRLLAQAVSVWPRAGFHRRLVKLALRRLRTHPWSPLPMVRL